MNTETSREKMLEAANALPKGSPERKAALRILFSQSKPLSDGAVAAELREKMQAAPAGSPERRALLTLMSANIGTNESIPGLNTGFTDHLDAQ